MRLSHSSSSEQRRTSVWPGRTSFLAALILATAPATAQTPPPGDPRPDEVVIRALDHTSRAPTDDAAPPQDRNQPDTTPAPAKGIVTNPPASATPEGKAVAPPASEPRSTTPTVADFSTFKIISERNIFDPNRSPRRAGGAPRRAKTVESVTLVGIMSYEKGDFAFFNGTSSDYKKVLKPSDTIAGYQLASISANSVKLASGEKQVELKIGSQLRREDEGEWTLSTQSEPLAASSPATSANTAKPAETGAADDGAESEVLKRLRQRREQE